MSDNNKVDLSKYEKGDEFKARFEDGEVHDVLHDGESLSGVGLQVDGFWVAHYLDGKKVDEQTSSYGDLLEIIEDKKEFNVYSKWQLHHADIDIDRVLQWLEDNTTIKWADGENPTEFKMGNVLYYNRSEWASHVLSQDTVTLYKATSTPEALAFFKEQLREPTTKQDVDLSKLKAGDSILLRDGSVHEVKSVSCSSLYYIVTTFSERPSEVSCTLDDFWQHTQDGTWAGATDSPGDIVGIIKNTKESPVESDAYREEVKLKAQIEAMKDIPRDLVNPSWFDHTIIYGDRTTLSEEVKLKAYMEAREAILRADDNELEPSPLKSTKYKSLLQRRK